MLMTTEERFFTLMRGIKAILPPVLVVVIFQRWFIKGLTERDK